uniref:Uncharacterized protein n=1 Tax=Oryza glumipatula TaxID=40148 RepID=A0A0D9Y6E5_9ORYZ
MTGEAGSASSTMWEAAGDDNDEGGGEEAARSGFGGSSLPTDGSDGKWVEGGGEVMAVLGRTEADPAGEWIQRLSGANPHRRCSAAASLQPVISLLG